jgi:hypothetical protein
MWMEMPNTDLGDAFTESLIGSLAHVPQLKVTGQDLASVCLTK